MRKESENKKNVEEKTPEENEEMQRAISKITNLPNRSVVKKGRFSDAQVNTVIAVEEKELPAPQLKVGADGQILIDESR